LKKIQLTCPCDLKQPLKELKQSFICEKNECIHNNQKDGFPIYNNIPVIISENKTDTVCKVEFGKTYVDRSYLNLSKYKKFIKGIDKTTERNCDKFINELFNINKNPLILIIGGGQKGDGTKKIWSHEKIEIHSIDIYGSMNVDII